LILYRLATQGPDNIASVLKLIKEIAASCRFNRVRGFFAYATERGTDLLIKALSQNMTNWNSIQKHWLISIDFARTDPEALKQLAILKNSEVRVLFFEEVMKNRFNPKICVHPKTLIFDTASDLEKGPAGLIIGSANLSLSGLTMGYENALAIIWDKELNIKLKHQLKSVIEESNYFEQLFSKATPLTLLMIEQYAKKRPRKKLKSEDETLKVTNLLDTSPEIPLDKNIALFTAKNLWVDVKYVVKNRGPGVPGNQIDLQKGTRVFFGFMANQVPPNTYLGDIRIRYKDKTVNCSMRFGNNCMDKLNLPVPRIEGPPSYENKTLLFQRQPDGSFILRVGKSKDVREWKNMSRKQGTLYTLKSGREYGTFD
jgi:HKD family nuclease